MCKRKYKLFYDIEVLRHFNLIVVKDINKQIKGLYIDDNGKKTFESDTFKSLRELVEKSVLIGYNNYFYDDIILTDILANNTLKQIKKRNDEIISGKKINNLHKSIVSLDVFQQILSRPSLKKLEANMGMNIEETQIPFDLDRALTPEEIDQMVFYCMHDVDATINVYKVREANYFDNKRYILGLTDNPVRQYRWNTTTIAANLLTDSNAILWSDYRLGKLDKDGNFEILKGMPKDVLTLFDSQKKEKKPKGKAIIKEDGTKYDFGFGGLHGVCMPAKTIRSNVHNLDVASMYPHIMLILGALGQSAETYKHIMETRLKAKKEGNKETSNALKLIINSTYGLLKNQYSKLYNPQASTSVCIYGQCALYNLCKSLKAAGYELININTDGVAFTGDGDQWETVKSEWEKQWQLTLEHDFFKTWIQKDVNNYFAVMDNGKIKTEGGDVSRALNADIFKKCSLRIIDIAILNYYLNGQSANETISENLNNPELFQFILACGPTFGGTVDENGKQHNKVNRAFAVKKGSPLYKLRKDGAKIKFQDVPENIQIENGEVKDVNLKEINIDLEFYIELTERKIAAWPRKEVAM